MSAPPPGTGAPEPPPVAPRSINICGYRNTGRAAASDWLHQHPNVVRFPNQESRFWRHTGGLWWLFRRLMGDGLAAEELDRFRQVVLGQVDDAFAATWPKPIEASYCNMDGEWARRAFGGRLEPLVETFLDEVRPLDKGQLAARGREAVQEDFLAASRRLNARLVEVLTEGVPKGRCAHANLFHAFLYPQGIRFFQHMDSVVVDRDPLDQYADLRQRDLMPPGSFAEFAREFLDHRMRGSPPPPAFAEPVIRGIETNRVIFIRFESLVLRPGYRERLREILGLVEPEERARRESRFDPAASARNVGIFEPFRAEMDEATLQSLAAFRHLP